MKSYTLPAFLLLILTGCLGLGIMKSFRGANRAKAGLAAEQAKVDSDRHDLAGVQRAAKATAQKAVESDAFLTKWDGELQSESSIEDIFGRLDSLAVGNLLAPSGKNFKLNTSYFFDGRHLPVQNVNIAVAGDFYRTVNWLGAAESAFPLARIEQINYTNTGNSLSLAVQFSFPRKFDLK
ncbi:MAG TPA: hypothetical protein VHV47_00125 [Opitutaceae bacterium]|nr:hypothetical protein [Opitutaceae bacterium]